MALKIDERTVRPHRCEHCGSQYEHVTGFVSDDGRSHAAYFAACHGHPEHMAHIDVILGEWGEAATPNDRVHFSCFLRPDSAMAADAPVAITADAPLLGTRLTRDEALEHPRVSEFWAVVDVLAADDPSVARNVYTDPPQSIWHRLLHRIGLRKETPSSDIHRR